MSDLYDQTQPRARSVSVVGVFMQQVYLWMCIALLVTAGSAYVVLSNPALAVQLGSGFVPILLIVALFAMVIALPAAIHKMSAAAATGLFLLYAALMGVVFAPTLMMYTSASVTKTFVITAGMFGGMSVFGMVTKKDLSGMGSFLSMGVWGLLLAMIVNIFMASPAIDFAISCIGVLIFTGLAAYDTQKLRAMGESAPLDDSLAIRRGAILGALTLYLDFINMFLFLLRLFGDRR